MNKYQKVYKYFKSYWTRVDGFVRKDYQYNLDKTFKENVDILKELVDKATPKKVERDLESYDAMPTLTTKCPNCKEMIWKCKDDERFKYCYCCGQRLSWGEEQ